MEIKEGLKIDGRYRVQELIGEGGMANVYLAEDIILGRPVAVKVLHTQLAKQERFVERFRREAEAVASLIHPHIVEIYDVGEQEGTYFIVMELLEGKTLKEYVKLKHFLSVSETISIMKQASQAVELAHKNGIIHRDLKPQNIFVHDDGTIKIMDFGIAYQQEATPLTQTNAVMGSVHYLSPEQAKGENATEQTDIYSLGIVMYEMLTGSVPFSGDSAVNIVLQHLREEIPYVSDTNMHIPQSVENIVIRATAKNPDDRYKNLGEMQRDLDTCLNVDRMNEPRVYFEPMAETGVISTELEEEIIEEETKPFKLNKKNATILGVAVVAAIVLITAIIMMFSNGGAVVPDVINKTKEEATSALEAANLKLGTVTEVASDAVEAGRVISTDKVAGTKVEKDTKINLTISKGKIVKMPGLVGRQQAEAETALTSQNIQYELKKGLPTNGEADGTVIAQSIAEGKDVILATDKVVITIAENERIELQDFTGKWLDQAKNFADAHKLKLAVTDEYSATVEAGVIIRMPSYWSGRTMVAGETIEVVVSKGPKPEPETTKQVETTENQTTVNNNGTAD